MNAALLSTEEDLTPLLNDALYLEDVYMSS